MNRRFAPRSEAGDGVPTKYSLLSLQSLIGELEDETSAKLLREELSLQGKAFMQAFFRE